MALFTSNIVSADNINELLGVDYASLSCENELLRITVERKNKISTTWIVQNQCGAVRCKDESIFTINDKVIPTDKLKKIINNDYKNFAVGEYERQNKNNPTIPTIDTSAIKAGINNAIIFEEGKTAYLSGKDKGANPYLMTENENSWLDGWSSGKVCDSDF